ncbi:glucokinase [Algoriphagus ratkowskyi]|uniref:Glucokinase n=1 Tax=Algoriphagus ratkowskyi TaxID=57028 RepID=A0A2W7SX71_9BACT|nr:ROK family protein [Algoriphagus ratkowskyi]PZX55422.1 glucokinase [Algoriphagus ratkowskyi]TXD79654.1 ROK family protein [Algoriphagus ratkowskyi]
MQNQEAHFLGVDVGGTHLKIGLVDREGNILDFEKENTTPYRDSPEGFGPTFIAGLEKYLLKYPTVKNVGIGLPGLISKDRTTALEIPAIPALNGFNLKGGLEEKFPKHTFFLENDAAAAAIGEFYFGKDDPAQNFLFITMGTGIGSALVLDGEVFKGSRGNAMEMGHMLSKGAARLETLVGRQGILNIMSRLIDAYPEKAGVLVGAELGTHLLVDTAKAGNPVSLMVFEEVGRILGEAIVSAIRILDVTEVYFGGGISAGLEFMMPTLDRTIKQYLTQYYGKDLILKKATLENNAGTLGAAALCFMGSGL